MLVLRLFLTFSIAYGFVLLFLCIVFFFFFLYRALGHDPYKFFVGPGSGTLVVVLLHRY